jgi:hypothetical protein
VILVSFGACLAAGGQSRWLQIALWTTVFLLVYHDVWEHHYVLLLPLFVLLYRNKPSRWLIVIYGLIAVWTPYRLIDPQGLAAYQMALRWTPLQPVWVNITYHASKALPAIMLWGYAVSLLYHNRQHLSGLDRDVTHGNS